MSLPINHSCDGPGCDPEDAEHLALRRRKQNNAKVRAGFKADQAWAKAREAMPALIKIKAKLSGNGDALSPEDIGTINMTISLVLGELWLRKSLTY